MCISVFMWLTHPLYPFILLLNRDEFLYRPTKPAEWWEGEEIIGGRDEQAGGTWLACSKRGKLAFLTNFRELDTLPRAKSRGELPIRFLKSEKGPAEFGDEVIEEADLFNGFNLILVDLSAKSMVYVTNRPKENKPSAVQVSPGIHTLTNASLDSPWPKAKRLLDKFKELINIYGEGEVLADEMMVKLMRDTSKADYPSLPGIYPLQFEYQLSSIYVDFDTEQGRYGTRSTSCVVAKVNGEVSFQEQYLEEGVWKDHTIVYQIE